MLKRKKGIKETLGFMTSIAAFICVIGLFIGGTVFFSQKADARGADTLRDAIRRASVQCYAIEGRYPPSVEYLEENYGIQIDRDRYNVFYSQYS